MRVSRKSEHCARKPKNWLGSDVTVAMLWRVTPPIVGATPAGVLPVKKGAASESSMETITDCSIMRVQRTRCSTLAYARCFSRRASVFWAAGVPCVSAEQAQCSHTDAGRENGTRKIRSRNLSHFLF
jgi:hypothetical protein